MKNGRDELPAVSPAAFSYAEELYAVRLVPEPPFLAALAGTLTKDEFRRMHDELDRMLAIVDRARSFSSRTAVVAADNSSPLPDSRRARLRP